MKVWKYDQDGINTDQLFPGKYTYKCSTAEEIRPYLLEDLDATFAKEAARGDVIMAGNNFGCGSSREQPVVGLKDIGIAAVIARSFARIFYRAAINQGLLLIESETAVDAYTEGMVFELRADKGEIEIDGKIFTFPPLPEQIIAIQNDGGLLAHTRKKLKARDK